MEIERPFPPEYGHYVGHNGGTDTLGSRRNGEMGMWKD